MVGLVRVADDLLSLCVGCTGRNEAGFFVAECKEEAVVVVLAVCGWTSAGESKHKILLCLAAVDASCGAAFLTNLPTSCGSVPGNEKKHG